MFSVYVLVATVAAALLSVSGIGKLRRSPYVVQTIHDAAGVPLGWLPTLAALEFAAAAGLLAEIQWAALGVAAAGGMAAYFVGAVTAHLRAGDFRGSWPAIQMLCLAAAALVTRASSA